MSYRPRILVVDDDSDFQRAVLRYADEYDYSVHPASSLSEARSLPEDMRFNLVLLDISLPDGSGLELLERHVDADYIAVVTGHPSVATAARAVGSQVNEYLVKPLSGPDLRGLMERVAVSVGSDPAIASGESCGELLGQSTRMQTLFREIRRVAPTDATVLITGESGTGKELTAQAIHQHSGRTGTFVALNCGAVPTELLASELFGHEKGSFTGAHRQHAGCFERANGGTVFLDEITEMPLNLQTHLLRVLETKAITRVGGHDEQVLDLRVIAACNRDPHQAVRDGQLREDLLYRLIEFPLSMPALRERGDDVIMLATTFLRRLNRKHGTSIRFPHGTERVLRDHDWPGNVRELLHCIRRSYLMADHGVARIELLNKRRIGVLGQDAHSMTFAVGTPFETMQRSMLLKTLSHFDNDKTRTARALGVSVKTIYNHLERIGES